MNAQQQTEPWDCKKGESKAEWRIGAQDFNEASAKAQRRLDVNPGQGWEIESVWLVEHKSNCPKCGTHGEHYWPANIARD